ncbi:MAG TPA: glutaredoxin family protein [Opitutaceae bacterium]|nr:glutaredoxin family protein [Opitutaceae bacterium]
MENSAFDETLPVLYLEKGEPRGEESAAFLDEHGVPYRRLEVNDVQLRDEAERKAGERGFPVLDWEGNVLAGFDVEQLVDFLHAHNVALEDS